MAKALLVLTLGLVASFAICHIDEYRIINDNNIITTINNSGTTWEAGSNERFADMIIKKLKVMLGSLKTDEDGPKLPLKDIEPLETLPENFDLREAYPTCESLREIRDQSNCGSCWAFGAAEAMSDRICIASGGKLQTRVSTENLLACCKTCGNGCNGGWPAAAWKFWQRSGLPSGGLYGDTNTCQPYDFQPCDHHVTGKYGPCGTEEYSTPKCKHTCNESYPKSFTEDLTFGQSAYRVRAHETQIMTEIYQHGSVEGAFSVYEDFPNYKSGVYQHVTGHELGGHAIKIIGWGVENGTKYWLCVNSWNEGWGDKGTFKILRGVNHCGIENEIVAGLPKLTTEQLKFLE